MPDHAAMYKVLFQSQTKAINILEGAMTEATTILKEAQQQTEEIYISTPEAEIILLDSKKQTAVKGSRKGTGGKKK